MGLYDFVRSFRRGCKCGAYNQTLKKHFKTSLIAVVLIEIPSEFTRSFKLQKVVKNQIHFNTSERVSGYIQGGFIFFFSFTGRWPITREGGGVVSGSLQYRFIQVSHAGFVGYRLSLKKNGQWCITAESQVADSIVLVHSVFRTCFTIRSVGIGLLSSVCCRS